MRKLDDGPECRFCFYLETYFPRIRLIASEISCLESSEMTTKMSIYNLQDLMIAYSVSTMVKELLAFTFPHLRMFTL